MNRYSVLFVLLLSVLVDSYKNNSHHHNLRTSDKNQYSPPHCTRVTKDTHNQSIFQFDYPIAYIKPGQQEGYQKMFCVNPATVNKAVSTVCDWVAPPQVQFTLGDEYLRVVRQDPTGRFLGNVVITTYQLCNHNLHRNGTRTLADVTVTTL